MRGAVGSLILLLLAGCAPFERVSATVEYPNPTLVPIPDPDYVWDKVVDVVDDLFEIEREERVRLVGDVVTEGFLETRPKTGATLLEPWHHDSANSYERLESTLQTIRRRAAIRVIPAEKGFLVEIIVLKELEDLARSEHAFAGQATFRNDSTLQRFREPVADNPLTRGWIPQGRDLALEQLMIARLQGSLGR